jgi:hypothetical protein
MAGLVIPPQIPIVEVQPGNVSPNTPSYTADSHCNEGDIVTLGGVTAGQIDPAVNNDGSNLLLGIVQMDSLAVYTQLDAGYQGVFGATNVNTGLLPAAPGQTMVALFLGNPVAINLTSTTGWVTGGTQQANIGTQVGLALVGGIYLADPTASNKVAYIVQKYIGATTQIVNSASAQPYGPGGVGDLGARVYIKFLTSALAPGGGGI